MRITLHFTPEEREILHWDAIASFNFLRENPKKAWTEKEKDEAIRYAVENIVMLHLESKG